MTITQKQFGLGGFQYYGNIDPFIDMMKNSYTNWGAPAAPYLSGIDGWLHAVPFPNSFITIIRVQDIHGEIQFTYRRSGTYYCTWSDTINWDVVILGGDGLTNLRLVSPGKYAADTTTNQYGQATNPLLRIQVTRKNTAGNADFTNCKFYYSGDETDLNNGEIFQKDFLDAHGGAQVNRFMDWNNTNTFGMSNDPSAPNGQGLLSNIAFTNFNVESDRLWYYLPPTVAAKLGAKLGTDIWYNVPVKCTSACMTSIANAIAGVGTFTGKIWPEYGNENWNTIFDGRSWLRDTKTFDSGGGLYKVKDTDGVTKGNVVDSNGNNSSAESDRVACAAADGAAAIWAAFELALGRSRVVRVLGGQVVNFDAMAAMFQYTDPRSNKKMKDLGVDQYAGAPYFSLATGRSVSSVDQTYMMENPSIITPDQWWLDGCENGVDGASTATAVNGSISGLASASSNTQFTCYEGGADLEFKIAPRYVFTINAGDNSLISSSSIDAGFSTGDIYTDYTSGFSGPPSSTPSSVGFCPYSWSAYVKKLSTTKIQLYADAALTTQLNLDQGAGNRGADNYTRYVSLAVRAQAFLDSQAGSTAEQYYYAFLNGKTSLFPQFVDLGGRSADFSFGFKNSQFLPDTPRGIWFEGTPSTLTDTHDGYFEEDVTEYRKDNDKRFAAIRQAKARLHETIEQAFATSTVNKAGLIVDSQVLSHIPDAQLPQLIKNFENDEESTILVLLLTK